MRSASPKRMLRRTTASVFKVVPATQPKLNDGPDGDVGAGGGAT